jgi:hypothetical protein
MLSTKLISATTRPAWPHGLHNATRTYKQPRGQARCPSAYEQPVQRIAEPPPVVHLRAPLES